MMTVTQVSLTDPDPGSNGKLLAYASVVIDEMIVIRDMKLVRREDGSLLVDFPSVITAGRCGGCGRKVECRVPDNQPCYCSSCGAVKDRKPHDFDRINVVHPINREGRRIVDDAVIAAYRKRLSAKQGRDETNEGEEP